MSQRFFDELDAKLLKALRGTKKPKFSLFRVSAKGDYELIFVTPCRHALINTYKRELENPNLCGLEIRCNGVRVEL